MSYAHARSFPRKTRVSACMAGSVEGDLIFTERFKLFTRPRVERKENRLVSLFDTGSRRLGVEKVFSMFICIFFFYLNDDLSFFIHQRGLHD